MGECTNPLLAARLYKPNIGKSVVKILPRRCDQGYDLLVRRYGRDNLFFLPCGRCPSCLARRKKEWSIRCCMESLDHQDNCFVTLTYDEEHYPGHLVKSDLVKFIKNLRNKGFKFRYFGCGENGEQSGRAHYHIILFGWIPDDLKYYSKSHSGIHCYESKIISSVWNKGLCIVQEFSPFAASYVAGYCLKKLVDRDDSFHIQSTRPGIGAGYFLRHIEDIYDTDRLVLNFGSHVFSVPRYFDKLAESLDLDLTDIKQKRLDKSLMLSYKAINESGSSCLEEFLVSQGQASERDWKYRKRML